MIRSIDPMRSVRLLVGGAILLGMVGCASGPSESERLPDEGPTTRQVYERHMAGEPPNGEPPATGGASSPLSPVLMPGTPIAPSADSETRGGRQALDYLQQDFQRVPNPEILGYVYPHLAGDLPVPGYYTAFPLRAETPYAEPGEGFYPGAAP